MKGEIPGVNPDRPVDISHRSHPRAAEVYAYLQWCIETKTAPKTYADMKVIYGIPYRTLSRIIKRAGFQDPLKQLRTEARSTTLKEKMIGSLLPSRDVAWFLGALTGTRGSVDTTRGRGQVSFVSKDANDPVSVAFKETGEALFGDESGSKRSHVRRLPSGAIAIGFYFGKTELDALGDFRKAETAQTVEQRYGWVFSEQYLRSFASGIFDSGGSVRVIDIKKDIRFSTLSQEYALLLEKVLRNLGINDINVFRRDSTSSLKYIVAIQKMAGLRIFAEKVTSIDPEKQHKLDEIRSFKERKKIISTPESAQEIFGEWVKIRGLLSEGKVPTTSDIARLRANDRTKFQQSVYTKFFGDQDGGERNAFSAARDRLEALAAMDPEERESHLVVVDRKVKAKPKKYSDSQLLAEWRRLQEGFDGRSPSRREMEDLYRQGETPYNVLAYQRRFGTRDDGSTSFSMAQAHLEALINQVGDAGEQVFP
ncbi:MAG: LAGLIDADG family homing endonuclease [Patescibacteria group bacterium]